MTDTLYTVESRDHRGRWVRSQFARPMSKEAAEQFAAEFEERGSASTRVVPWDKGVRA